MSENAQEFDQERQSLMVFIWKKRKILITLSLIAAVASLIVSLMITPIFKSTAIVFSSASSTVSFSDRKNFEEGSMDIGEEEHEEQLVQILQTDNLKNRIIEKFNLYERYGIQAEDKYRKFNMNKRWKGNIQFSRTKFGSINIDVYDIDPQVAADIANEIVALIDTVKNDILKERMISALKISQRKMDILVSENNTILDEMDSLSRLGVVSIEARANLYIAYTDAKSASDKAFFKSKIDANIEHGARFDALETLRDAKATINTQYEVAHQQAESDANTIFSHKFIVQQASPADKKDKPKKLIIILLSTIGTFIFVVFILLMNEKLKELKKS